MSQFRSFVAAISFINAMGKPLLGKWRVSQTDHLSSRPQAYTWLFLWPTILELFLLKNVRNRCDFSLTLLVGSFKAHEFWTNSKLCDITQTSCCSWLDKLARSWCFVYTNTAIQKLVQAQWVEFCTNVFTLQELEIVFLNESSCHVYWQIMLELGLKSEKRTLALDMSVVGDLMKKTNSKSWASSSERKCPDFERELWVVESSQLSPADLWTGS